MALLLGELTELYAALRRGPPARRCRSCRSSTRTSRSGSASWLRGEELARQVAYWQEQLAGAPPLLELPTDRPRPAVQSFRGARQRLSLPAELARSLEVFGRREGLTPFMVLLAAFQALLGRYTAQGDVVVGTPIANRTRTEVERLIGFFVNTLVFRTAPGGRSRVRGAGPAGARLGAGRPTTTRTCRSRSWSTSCTRSAT